MLALQYHLRPTPRPRCRRGGVYMPDWYRRQQRELAAHMTKLDIVSAPVSVDIIITRQPGVDADVDNLAKAVLDALVDAGVLANDSWRFVPSLSVRVLPIRDGEHETLTVSINELR